jgi:hypothetical protein
LDANNLSTAAVPVAEPKVLKSRDAAYKEVVKSAFQEYTRHESPKTYSKLLRADSLKISGKKNLLGLSLADYKALMPDVPRGETDIASLHC